METRSYIASNFRTNNNHSRGLFSTPPLLLPILAVAFVLQIYQLIGRPWAVAYAVLAYSNLLLFYWCFDKYDKMPKNSSSRETVVVKLALWLLSTALVVMLTYGVAAIMPPAGKVLICCMVAASIFHTTYALFVRKPDVELPLHSGKWAYNNVILTDFPSRIRLTIL